MTTKKDHTTRPQPKPAPLRVETDRNEPVPRAARHALAGAAAKTAGEVIPAIPEHQHLLPAARAVSELAERLRGARSADADARAHEALAVVQARREMAARLEAQAWLVASGEAPAEVVQLVRKERDEDTGEEREVVAWERRVYRPADPRLAELLLRQHAGPDWTERKEAAPPQTHIVRVVLDGAPVGEPGSEAPRDVALEHQAAPTNRLEQRGGRVAALEGADEGRDDGEG